MFKQNGAENCLTVRFTVKWSWETTYTAVPGASNVRQVSWSFSAKFHGKEFVPVNYLCKLNSGFEKFQGFYILHTIKKCWKLIY